MIHRVSPPDQIARHQGGMTLIELAVVLVILALLMGLGMTMGQMQIKISKHQGTQTTLANAKEVLDGFYKKYQRFPCPAVPSDAPTDTTYGMEVTSCTGACPAGMVCPAASNAVIGTFPFNTLGLGEEFASDGWNHKIVYVVDKNHTVTTPAAIYGTLPITDSNGNEITQSPLGGDAIFLLISHGANGNGAWSGQGGTQSACDSTLKDGENCDNDAVWIDTSLQDGTTAANYFDDIVIWEARQSTDHIVIPAP
jgi:prepilin-type N-terminal cleavage/methylation domain-containing protein